MDPLSLARQLCESLREAPIKIFAGSGKTVCYVHPGVLQACKSSTADVRMSGPWKNTGDGAIDWTDFDEQTIECVLQYLYTGDYHILDTGKSSAPIIEDIENGLRQTGGGWNGIVMNLFSPLTVDAAPVDESSPVEGPPAPPRSPSPSVGLLSRPLTPFQDCVGAGFPAERKQTAAGVIAEKDFKRDRYAIGVSVLRHASIYSFAHRHFFSDLAKLALQRLTQVLSLAPCEYTELFPHLGDAIRHIYDTTPGPDMQVDPARKLLSQYVALNYTNLTGGELDALVEEGGELMVDVSSKLARLLATRNSQVCALEGRIDSLSAEVGAMQIICKDKETEIQQLQARQKAEDF